MSADCVLDDLPQRFRVILCDLWGCVHNGEQILSGVVERLDQWAAEGRRLVFLTNAPRPANAVAEQLSRLGLPDRLNGSIVSSGDVALAWLAREARSRAFAFIGGQADAAWLEARGIHFVTDDGADTVICTGFDARGFELDAYGERLNEFAANNVEMLCFNPDRIVHRGERVEPCAGAIAEAYAAIGGAVRMFGKPYEDIYAYAVDFAGGLLNRRVGYDEVVAIGDSVATDFAGAANAGIDFIFVTGGIDHAAYRVDPVGLFVSEPNPDARPKSKPIAIVMHLGRAKEYQR
jgi:HAD superfamily hydrolase (TIGR01459 family)